LNLPADTERITQLKTEAAAEVDKLKDFSQQMVDQIFSYDELGFQEFETSKYPDGVHGDVGQRQAGDRARVGHRRHPAVVAEAWRGVSRADDRRRARARRGT